MRLASLIFAPVESASSTSWESSSSASRKWTSLVATTRMPSFLPSSSMPLTTLSWRAYRSANSLRAATGTSSPDFVERCSITSSE